MTKKIIILMGLPGSGKGTQGHLLAQKMSIPHISTGDIFRKMIKDKGEDSALLMKYMDTGALVPSDFVNKIVKNYILSDACKNGCILDGYPRTLSQAEYLVENVKADITTIFLDLDDKEAANRILGRITCEVCGRTYNKVYAPPLAQGYCDTCRTKSLSVRSDDDEKTIMARLVSYRKETVPMIEFYKKRARYYTVNAAQDKKKVIEDVLDNIKRV
ncbi:MAG: adenylate kinase family protein [Rickettsiaceae bacterium]